MSERAWSEQVVLGECNPKMSAAKHLDVDGTSLVGLVITVGVKRLEPEKEPGLVQSLRVTWCLEDAVDEDGWWETVEATNGRKYHTPFLMRNRKYDLDCLGTVRFLVPMAVRLRLFAYITLDQPSYGETVPEDSRAEGIVAKLSYRSV